MNPETEDILDFLDGSLPEHRQAELKAWLGEDPARWELLARLSFVHTAIGDTLRKDQEAQAAVHTEAARTSNEDPGNNPLAELARREMSVQAQLIELGTAEHAPPNHQEDEGLISARDMVAIGGYLLRKAALSKPAILAYAAAVALLAAVLIIPWGPTPQELADNTSREPAPVVPELSPTVATLTAQHDAQWGGPASSGLATGDTFRPGQRLTLTAGFAQITTHAGAVAILEAPATIELTDNNNALRLITGKLVGICETESSQGFLVRTPHMDVTDLGTRFGVDATQSDATEVHVYEGEVEVSRPSADQPSQRMTQRLVQGQAVKSDATGVAFVTIEPAFDRFAGGLNVHRLPGTGYGVERMGQPDSNWRVVEVNGERLEAGVPLVLGLHPGLSAQTPNDPEVARWLRLEDPDRFQGDQEAVYIIQTTIDVPQDIDLETAVLHVDFHADDHLELIGFNAAPNPAWRAAVRDNSSRGRMSLSLSEQYMRLGRNVVHVYVRNAPKTELYLHLAWHIEPLGLAE